MMPRHVALVLLLTLGALLITACGRGDIFAPTPTSVLFVPSPTPRATANPTQAAMQAAARGEQLFNTYYQDAGFQCSTCHNVASNERLVGPGLLGLGARAATRVEGLSAEEYLHQSILEPNAHITVIDGEPPYPPNLMPQVYQQIFSEAQLADLIAYLMTL